MKVYKGNNNTNRVVVTKVKESPKGRIANCQNGKLMVLNTSTIQTSMSPQHLNQGIIISTTPQVTSLPSAGKGDILLSNVHLVSALQSPIIWPGDGIIKQSICNNEKLPKDNEKIVRANHNSSIVANDLGSHPPTQTLLTIMAPQTNNIFNNSQPQQLIMLGELAPNQIILTSPNIEESAEVLQCKQVPMTETPTARINIEPVTTSNILVINEKSPANCVPPISAVPTSDLSVRFEGVDERGPSKKRIRKANLVSTPTSQAISETHIYLTTSRQQGDNIPRQIVSQSDLQHQVGPLSRNSQPTDGTSEIGYTAQLLSQLNDSGALPAISSSQVSSVLSALEPTAKSPVPTKQPQQLVQTTQAQTNSSNHSEQPNSAKPSSISNSTKKADSNKLKVQPGVHYLTLTQANPERNLPGIYQCPECNYLSIKSSTVEEHFKRLHLHVSNIPVEKKKHFMCIGCNNVFFSKHALQVHLIQDHEVSSAEVSLMTSVMDSMATEQGKTSETSANSTDKEQQGNSNVVDAIEKPSVPNTDQSSANKSFADSITSETIPSILTTSASKDSQSMITVTTVRDLNASTQLTNEPSMGNLTPQFSDGAQMFSSSVTQSSNQASNNNVDAEKVPIVDIVDNDGFKMKEDEEELAIGDTSRHQNSIGNASIMKPNGVLESGISWPPDKKRGRAKCSQDFSNISKKVDCKTKVENRTQKKCGIDGCALRLHEEANLVYHHQCHKENSFECPECSHKAPQWSNMAMHLWQTHKIDMELYSCTKCPYKTYNYSKLKNLHARIHSSERPFLCDKCGKGFKTRKQMRNHKVLHKNSEPEETEGNGGSATNKLSCAVCGRKMSDARNLRLHMENVHDKMRKFFCKFCEYSTYSRGSLVIHDRTHTGEKPFKCEVCEYATSDHNSLRRHKMQHSGVKPYNCPHCSYACIQSTTFKSHLKSKHPGLDDGLMFSCAECPFRTINKDKLLSHSASHTGSPLPRPHPTPITPGVELSAATSAAAAAAAATAAVQVLSLMPPDTPTTDFLQPTPVSLEVAELPVAVGSSEELETLPISGLAHGEIIISDDINQLGIEDSNDSSEMIIPESQDNR